MDEVWESSENCHGAFGESNEVFTPIVGHTTKEDIKTGRVAALRSGHRSAAHHDDEALRAFCAVGLHQLRYALECPEELVDR